MGMEAKAAEYQAFIMKEFGLDMTTEMVTNYKSTLKAALEKSPVTQAPKAPPAKSSGGFSLNELEAVKALADKFGARR